MWGKGLDPARKGGIEMKQMLFGYDWKAVDSFDLLICHVWHIVWESWTLLTHLSSVNMAEFVGGCAINKRSCVLWWTSVHKLSLIQAEQTQKIGQHQAPRGRTPSDW